MFKRLAKSPTVLRILAALISFYIRMVGATSRWSFDGVDRFEDAAAEEKGVIMAFWHGRMLMGPTVRKKTDRRVYMLISAHRDGEIIAQGVKGFGIDFIRGSAANINKPGKEKRGASAIAQMIAALSEGHVVGFTPDGPRGPGEKVKPGVIRLAQLSGAPIIPCAYSASRGAQVNSWDRFLLAAPFSKGYYIAGEAIHVPADAGEQQREALRAQLETQMRAITAEADTLAGRRSRSANGRGR